MTIMTSIIHRVRRARQVAGQPVVGQVVRAAVAEASAVGVLPEAGNSVTLRSGNT